MLCAAIAYELLQHLIIKHHGSDHVLSEAVGRDWKGKISLAFYLAAIPLAFVNQWIADAFYVTVAAIWLMPDKRIESRISG